MAKKVCLYVSIFVEAGHMEAVEAVGGCQAGDERVKDVLENRKLNFTSMTKASSGCQALASPPSFFSISLEHCTVVEFIREGVTQLF